jgi:hypothetical protein
MLPSQFDVVCRTPPFMDAFFLEVVEIEPLLKVFESNPERTRHSLRVAGLITVFQDVHVDITTLDHQISNQVYVNHLDWDTVLFVRSWATMDHPTVIVEHVFV